AAVGADGAVALDDLRADLPGVSARGALVVGTLAKGTVTLALTDLAPLGQLAGLALAGSGDGRVVLGARKGAQTVQARVALADLSLDGTRLAALEATADANLAGDVAVDVTARDLTQGPVKLESARLQATGTAKALDWRADLAGRLAETFALAAKGHLRPDDSLLTLAALDGQVAGQALRLNGPVDLAYGDGLVLGPLDLAVGSGRLALDATVRGEAIAANLDAAGLPLALAKVAAKGPIPDGTLDAKGRVALAPGADRADVTLALRAARTDLADLGQDVVLPALALDATAALADGTLALQAGLSGPVKEPLKAHLSLPVARPAGGGLPAPVPGGALAGALVWRGDLAELEPYIPAAEHHIAGAVAVDLALAGTLDAPAVTGQADITNGLYENLTWGTRLTDLTVNAKGGEALTITAQGTDGEAGRLSAQANLALDASTVTARVDLNALRFVRRDDLDAFIGGTVDLSLADGGGAVKGDLTLEPVEVRLLDNLPPSVVVLDITEESDAQAEKAAAAPPQKALDLDVTVNIPRRAFVRGRGVDSEWAGRIVVTGTSAAPRVDGTIEIVRGQVTALGKLFQVTRGTVTLDGASPPDPVLDVVAATTAKDLTVTLTVGGRASAPTIALGSDPAMPQDEILARLLFGKNAGSLGPAEALALASAAASLASGDGGVMDKLRSASGLDVLRADTGDKGSPRVSAGKYVAEGVYVGVNRGLDPGSGSVTIEVDVTKSISVESEIGSNAQGNLGVNWTHDY
ncbi:MAG: translocation/assembly module TamB domain-containing protein, partial [Rhodobacterales bacterium]|nr:translocation/assembly module TamB domain-containing protein [Rhodobacterales bacterium]